MGPYYAAILVSLVFSAGFTYTAYTANVDEIVNKNLNSVNRKKELQKDKAKIEMYRNKKRIVPPADPMNNPAETNGVIMTPDQKSYNQDLQETGSPIKTLEDPAADISREVSAEKDEAFKEDRQKKALIRAIQKKAEEEGYKVNVEGTK